ncbi:hypothetical protein [Brevibacterium sp. W7.2]|uniref:hypothetical protein n=1 Tax=Brevibacterium sp. W7.2 TaxID=2823518 RepID=UPI001BAD838E|nr:hypothetical protein [Brevibacterium sp. W7.2]
MTTNGAPAPLHHCRSHACGRVRTPSDKYSHRLGDIRYPLVSTIGCITLRCPQAPSQPFRFHTPLATMVHMFGYLDTRPSHRLFLTGDAGEHGVTEWDLRQRSSVRTISHGIRADDLQTVWRKVPSWADEQWEAESEALRALELRYPLIAASHSSAARLFGLPLPRRLTDGPLHVCSDDRDLRIRRSSVVRHRVADFSTVSILGHTLVSPSVLFLQLATILDRDELVRVGDAMIGRWHGPPLCTLEELVAHLRSRASIRRRRVAESGLELVRPGVDSPRETDLRLWAISVGLPEPEVHPAVFCRQLGVEIHPDLGYRRALLGLEYEGDHHRTDRTQWDEDIRRVNALNAEGWLIIRVNSRTDMVQLEFAIRQRLTQKGLL